jgi:hypothetical protein
MTVGRISVICWIVYAVMCAAFLPLGAAIHYTHLLPDPGLLILTIVIVGVLWWGPFAYAMYLSFAVIKNGDPRLLRRGIRGTAVVLRGRATSTYIRGGGAAWQTSRVYDYRLRVSIHNREPYETSCRVCAGWISDGSTVDVAVSRRNHRRVMIDVGQDREGSRSVPAATYTFSVRTPPAEPADTVEHPVDDVADTPGWRPGPQPATNAERIAELTQLGRLHREGVLTDDEFAAEKARILGE